MKPGGPQTALTILIVVSLILLIAALIKYLRK
jgi:nitrogen fixation-related uncharacterized protein